MTRYNFAQGQLVSFSMQIAPFEYISGTGRIIGVAVSEMPVIGCSYIVQPVEFFGNVRCPSETYPFECLCITENFLKASPCNL